MNLLCVTPAIIGLIFTMERITEGVIGLSIVGLTDRLGRRRSALLFFSINLLAQTIIIFCPWYSTRMLGYILYACGNIKNSIFYVWIFEMIETRHKSSACTVINAMDSSTMIGFGLYVLFISKNWLYI